MILAIYFPIVLYSSARLSPAFDEIPHIHSGLTLMSREVYVDTERAWWTRMDLLHPVMDIAPALLARAAGAKPDFRDTPNPTFTQVRAARWANHLLGALILAMLYFWGEALWGAAGALIATAFFACYPTFLAHSSIVSSDEYMVLGALAALWTIWRLFIRAPERLAAWGRPLWLAALAAGAAVAFAICCKLNNIVFCGVAGLAALWAAWRSRGSDPPRAWLARGLAAGIASGVLALGLATLAYEATHSLPHPIVLRGHTVNLPLGQPFLASVNTARKINLSQPEGVYYAGSMVIPGMRHYLVAFLIKTPLPLLALTLAGLAGAALAAARRRETRSVVYLAALAAFLTVSFTSRHIFVGMRHLLLVIALAALLAGALGQAASLPRKRAARALLGLTWLCLGWAAAEMLLATPWQLSYFNPFGRGRIIFADSELDWGQGLIALREWQQRNCPDRPLWLAYFGTNDPADFGVRYRGLYAPFSLARQDPAAPAQPRPEALAGEVVAISMTHLAGTFLPIGGKPRDYYKVWRAMTPNAVAGGSIAIYDLRGAGKPAGKKP